MIFGMLGLGIGLEQTGLARIAAEQAAEWFRGYGPYAVLAALYLLSAVLTELISNNAVAALLTPIAIGDSAGARRRRTSLRCCRDVCLLRELRHSHRIPDEYLRLRSRWLQIC